MPVRAALLSVSDKRGLVELARGLAARGVALLSSGGTARALEDAGVAVTRVEDYTGSPEVMGGRVKTLHPRVHGGILAREGLDDGDLARVGGRPIDLVVVNLYPFERVAARADASWEELVENIDIGGPSMVRSAAKNHARVAVVTSPDDYGRVLAELESTGEVSASLRRELAVKAFAATAAYDAAIAGRLARGEGAEGGEAAGAGEAGGPAARLELAYDLGYGLRYGENPHQAGAFYVERGAARGTLARAESLGSGAKELSFNNLADADAALAAVRELDGFAAVVVKHANPCGVATGDDLASAYLAAREADALSAFGGIVALSHEVDERTAALLAETFLECVVAPSFAPAALTRLREKKNLRLLATGPAPALAGGRVVKAIGGGLLVQAEDPSVAGEIARAKVVTKRAPTDDELRGLELAWRVVKHVKSNAIVLARADAAGVATVGVGAGQMSRVVSVAIACQKAGAAAEGAVLASDAFFPFADGLEAAAAAGVRAVAQPGGSVKDAEVIARADALGLAMIFTGMRHFRH